MLSRAIALVCIVPVLAACEGGTDSTAPAEAGAVTAADAEAPPTTEDEAVTTDAALDARSQPAAGSGTLELADGRVFAITISSCDLRPTGMLTVNGSGDDGAVFELTQLYLGETWSRTQASLTPTTGDPIYATASSAVADAGPAAVDGTSVSWTHTFRELDESANSHVFTGAGTVRVTCP